MIEESGDGAECRRVYTSYYGYGIEAIAFRIILMRRLGADEDDVDAFRRSHIHFRSVRQYYMQRAREEKNLGEEMRLLEESRRLDAGSAALQHAYSKRLIEILHETGDYAREKMERREAYLNDTWSDLDAFRAYRQMCSGEEWTQERPVLIASKKDLYQRCELLAEEHMLMELFEQIEQTKDNIPLLDKYGFLLGHIYAEQILTTYMQYVEEIAADARNRTQYNLLISYLKRMQQYPDGTRLVRMLCLKWIEQYPTRRVMTEELRELLRS